VHLATLGTWQPPTAAIIENRTIEILGTASRLRQFKVCPQFTFGNSKHAPNLPPFHPPALSFSHSHSAWRNGKCRYISTLNIK